MSANLISIILGGILPAFLFGFANVSQKIGSRAGIGTGAFLILVGLTTVLVGIVSTFVERDGMPTFAQARYGVFFGLCWAIAIGGISAAFNKFGGQLSQLAPLYNTNTLIAVFVGLFVLSEWHSVNVPKILAATLLIIIGSILAATA